MTFSSLHWLFASHVARIPPRLLGLRASLGQRNIYAMALPSGSPGFLGGGCSGKLVCRDRLGRAAEEVTNPENKSRVSKESCSSNSVGESWILGGGVGNGSCHHSLLTITSLLSFFESGSHGAQAGLRLAMGLRTTLNL